MSEVPTHPHETPTTSAGESAATSIGTMNIGAVAKATGIPVETLRTWERRYGFPKPLRGQSGHRMYDPDIVEQLKLVAIALEKKFRASQVVGMATDDLRQLLADSSPDTLALPASASASVSASASASASVSASASTSAIGIEPPTMPRMIGKPKRKDVAAMAVAPDATADLAHWLAAVQTMDAPTLEHGLRTAWCRLGALNFLLTRISPFLYQLGEQWALGRIQVSNEHFASERLRDFLTNMWRPIAEMNAGPIMVCGTLSDEQHQLGLQMAACLAALAGCRVVFLGAGVPVSDLVTAALQSDGFSVLISVSVAADSATTAARLRALRSILPPHVGIVVGGTGAPAGVEGTTIIQDWLEFWHWLAALSADDSRSNSTDAT